MPGIFLDYDLIIKSVFRKLHSLVLAFIYIPGDFSKKASNVVQMVSSKLDALGLGSDYYAVTDEGANMLSFSKFSKSTFVSFCFEFKSL
jgi:hypothetical protein